MTDDSTDDSDSFTVSSSSEDLQSQDEWSVTKILAEAKVAGVQKYLIEWSDFPLCDATWEPAEHLSHELLTEWRASVEETGRTTVPGFKISDWRKAVNADIRAKYAKYEARNKKRALLGLKQKILPCNLQDWLDSVEGPSEDEDYDRHTKKNKTLSNQKTTREGESGNTGLAGTRPSKHSFIRRQQEPQASGLAKKFKGSGGGISSSSSSSLPKRTTSLAVNPISSKEAGNKTTTSPSNTSKTPRSSNGAVVQPGKGQAFANNKTRTVARRSTLNVFVGGKERKRRRNLLDAVSSPTGPPKFFNYRKRWQIEKAQRDREGIRPPTQLPASLPLMPIRASRGLDADSVLLDDGRHDKILEQSSRSHLSESGCSKRKQVRWADDLDDEPPSPADSLESLFVSDGEEAPEGPKTKPSSPSSQGGKVVASPCPSSADENISPCLSVAESTIKMCQFGPNLEASVKLRFSGWTTDNKSAWSLHLRNQSPLRFSHMCTMKDLMSQTDYAKLEEITVCRGTIDADDESRAFLELLAKRLQLGQLAFMCLVNDKSSIALAIHAAETPLAGNPFNIDSHSRAELTRLQYFIFLPDPPVSELMLAPLPRTARQESELDVFHFFLGNTFERHFRNNITEGTTQNFFLVFPSSAYQEAAMVSQWLRESDSSCTIKTSLVPGQWAEFASLDRGNVIFHEDAVWVIRSMPQIGAMLHSQVVKMYFWSISRSSLHSKANKLTPGPANYRLRQILRSGTVFLVTPSFLISQPEQAYNFVKFFWKSYTSHSPIFRFGKLAVASDISCWLAELAVEKAQSWSRFREPGTSETNRDNACEALFKCFKLLRNLIDDIEDGEESPFIYAPDVLDGNDEQSLVNWFGAWTVSHNQQFRKFYVLGSSHQSVARLSRKLQPVQFVPTTKHDDACHMTLNDDRTGPLQPPDVLMKIREALADIERRYKPPPFNPLVLYKYPVVKEDADMTCQGIEPHGGSDDFARWFSFFAEPFFGNIYHIRTKFRLPNFKNTFVGLFYTKNHNLPSNVGTDAQLMMWSPWIAIYRPSDLAYRPWDSMDLFIWDPNLMTRVTDPEEPYEDDLLSSQRQLVRFIRQKTRDRDDALPLRRIWLGPVDDHHRDYHGREDVVDCALRWLDDLPSLFKQNLPIASNSLTGRGWRHVNPGPRPAPEPMDLDSSSSGSLPLRAILPPPGAVMNSQGAPYGNYFRDAILGHRGPGPIPFTFQPTLKWYMPQFEMGLGYQHIVVSPWQPIFERYGIHDPERDGTGQKTG
ncbi:hypothetical protein E4U43_005546 [Claviceps pusilla]|uniref:Chromo domain-containing protein n=1 Tax=Claviceps pusilla TaxID=123648 RepID=A0A9P7NGJ3_9HYPO|nr:hypothetical protein E4U43_005546 [Claviceps pusilla]